ncbi:hypothetical protein C8R45DRAFT_1081017 [Mycena sanguinolenta]|nr:hypothetical protein C8R45DRAFT_1081017 [Mycena sanguinolenta]
MPVAPAVARESMGIMVESRMAVAFARDCAPADGAIDGVICLPGEECADNVCGLNTNRHESDAEKKQGMTTTKGLPIPVLAYRPRQSSSGWAALRAAGRVTREANIATALRTEMLKSVTRPEHWGDCKMTLPSIPGGMSHRRYQLLNIDELPDLHVWAHNEMLRDRPAGMRIGLHMCLAEISGKRKMLFIPLFHDLFKGSYETIAEKMSTMLTYDQFYLEYDDPARQRCGSCLRARVSCWVLCPPRWPSWTTSLYRRIWTREAAEVIAKGQGSSEDLPKSLQCGFASLDVNVGKGFTEEKIWAKLVLLRDLARRLWKDAV